MNRQYRIENWRLDVPAQTIETPTFEGKDEEECDQKAISRMEELSSKESYSWDGLKVLRIDVPAVAEKTTFLKNNGRQE